MFRNFCFAPTQYVTVGFNVSLILNFSSPCAGVQEMKFVVTNWDNFKISFV